MKNITFKKFIMEGNEGYSFSDVINNLTESQLEEAAEKYHKAKMKFIINELTRSS